MSGKVTKQGPSSVAVTAKKTDAAKPAPPPKPSAPAAQLNERELRRTGKASGFTKTFTPLPSAPQASVSSDAPVLRAGNASTLQRLQAGGQMPTTTKGLEAAERAVAFNPGFTQEWSMAAVQKDPKKFLKDVVQLDGSPSSTVDRSSCGPTALLMGMIAGRPQALQELAGKLVDAKGEFTQAGKIFGGKLSSGARDDLHDSLVRLREGKAFTPADVTQLAECMQGVETRAGAAPNDLREAARAIELLGVKLPAMELQLFGNPDGSMGHWRVESNGTQFNPWPDKNGQSTQLPAKKGLEDGARDGAGWVRREQVAIGSK